MIDPAGERARRRVRPRQDPRARRGPGRRRGAHAAHYPLGTKRPCVDTDYFETFNRDNVSLVDLRADADRGDRRRRACARARARTRSTSLVFATGFDAMTGALNAIDIRGRDGVALRDGGPAARAPTSGSASPASRTCSSSPGRGSPSVFSNMVVSIEQHVDWIADAIAHMRDRGLRTHRAHRGGAGRLGRARRGDRGLHARDAGELLVHGRERPRQAARVHALPRRRRPVPRECDEIAAAGYEGFALVGASSAPDELHREQPERHGVAVVQARGGHRAAVGVRAVRRAEVADAARVGVDSSCAWRRETVGSAMTIAQPGSRPTSTGPAPTCARRSSSTPVGVAAAGAGPAPPSMSSAHDGCSSPGQPPASRQCRRAAPGRGAPRPPQAPRSRRRSAAAGPGRHVSRPASATAGCASRPRTRGDPHRDLVDEAPGPVLAGLERADDRVAGLPRRAASRAGSASRRSSRRARTRGRCAGAATAPPAREAVVAAVDRLGQLRDVDVVEVGARAPWRLSSRVA